ncbi:MAG: YdcF family protein [bacterium]
MSRKTIHTILRHFLYFILLEIFILFIYGLAAGSWLTVRDIVNKADAVWVLGGDSVDFHRTRHGKELFEQGVADTVLFTGAGKDLQLILHQAREWGVPASQYVAFDSCRSTVDEAKAVKSFVEKYAINSIVFVTDIYHTRRAKNTFEKYLPDVIIYSSPARNSNYNEKYWWKTEEGFVAVFMETLKVVYYLFAHRVCPF